MGSISRMHMEDKLIELFKEEIEKADVVVMVSGGIATASTNRKNLSVIVIDADNADDLTSDEITKEIAEQHGVISCY